MEANLRSRKRKETSPPPSFSTSKSHNLHHNKSIGVITRRNHTQFVDESPRVKSRKPNQRIPLEKDNLSHVSVKDLRSRRVFSPTSSLIEDEDYKDGGDSKLDHQLQMPNGDKPNLGSYESHCDEDDASQRSELQDLSNGSVELVVDLNRQVSLMKDSSVGNLNDNVGALNLSEENAQVTPPAAGEIGGNGGISNTSVCRNLIDSSNVSIRSKRVKVFRTPTSFSYRRLLPYLKEISKDDAGLEKLELVDAELPSKVQKSDNMNNNVSSVSVENQYISGKEDDNGADCTDGKLLENNGIKAPNTVTDNEEQSRYDVGENILLDNDEAHQMTPPDPEIFSKPNEGEIPRNKDENILQNDAFVLDKPLNQNSSQNDGGDIDNTPNSDQTKGFISKSNQVLNPCSRKKIFKIPSSLSYRRLLPFLMDVAKDNPCLSTISQDSKHEKDMDPKPHQLTSPSLPHDVHRGESEIGSKTEDKKLTSPSLPLHVHRGEPEIGSKTEYQNYVVNEELKLLNDLTEEASQSLPISTSVGNSSPNGTEPSDLPSENSTQLQEEPIDSLHPQTDNDVVSYATYCTEVSSSSIVNLEKFPREPELNASEDTAIVDSEGDQLQQIGNEKESLCPNSPPSKAIVPYGITAVDGTKKGILRRNPRGCRGLCNCLNCASFQLHAEKAFEFSRNQMHDTEEIAAELINELGYLRKMLNDTVANPHIVKIDQVNEACNKTLKTEELIRKRLEEMNEDLNYHCRNTCLQRPRVTFSANIKEKLIPKTGNMEIIP